MSKENIVSKARASISWIYSNLLGRKANIELLPKNQRQLVEDEYVSWVSNLLPVEQALTELEELKKRDTPTTPFHITSTYEGRVGNCPYCNKLVDELTVDAFNRPLHICGCGQKLDWKEK